MRVVSITGLLLILAAAAAPSPAARQDEAIPAATLQKASVAGKYRKLLKRIAVPDDLANYGELNDYGHWEGTSYAGFEDLPPGFWVYLHPHWYIWSETTAAPPAAAAAAAAAGEKRSWGPEQALGPPNTLEAGDLQTAWASQTADEQDEWLQLDFPEAVIPAGIIIHETFNPGALVRVTLFRPDTEEVDIWRGKDPTPTDAGHGVSLIPVKADFKTSRVRIFLDSKSVPGWNEIDAVGLIDQFGNTQWASKATASSTYASGDAVEVDPLLERLQALERDVAQLRSLIEARARTRPVPPAAPDRRRDRALGPRRPRPAGPGVDRLQESRLRRPADPEASSPSHSGATR